MRQLTAVLALGLLAASSARAADLAPTKTYMLSRLEALKVSSSKLVAAGDAYYALAKGAGFDYAQLWKTRPDRTRAALDAVRAAWKDASPRYEQIEGFFAGNEPFTSYDTIIDAADPGTTGDNTVKFDVRLPDGRVLHSPGALFNFTESALWDLNPNYRALKVNLGGQIGNALPDANVVKGGVAALDSQIAALLKVARGWQPSTPFVFTTLVSNLPTTGDFLDIWKNSRFVQGGGTKETEFAAISRLNDLRDNIGSWQAIYRGVSPDVKSKNAALDSQVTGGLTDLRAYVQRLIAQEQVRRFTPEQAEGIISEAQNRATALTGKLTQAAALLNVKVSQ